ncbi:hypothetical protein LTR17_024848 [Elasticomyces elasticus]|nr:hypothetical protein LTR17_024848 [Elasticomyces elasticus]
MHHGTPGRSQQDSAIHDQRYQKARCVRLGLPGVWRRKACCRGAVVDLGSWLDPGPGTGSAGTGDVGYERLQRTGNSGVSERSEIGTPNPGRGPYTRRGGDNGDHSCCWLADVFGVVSSSDAASWLYAERIPHLMNIDNPPFSSLDIILKNLTLLISIARLAKHPLPLTSLAQQAFLMAKLNGYDTHDDCATLKLYPAHSDSFEPSTRREAIQKPTRSPLLSTHVIVDLLRRIHAAAAMEALSLLQVLDLDQSIFCAFVRTAAGDSEMFRKISESTSAARFRAICLHRWYVKTP